jgi:phage terminase large subunit-like protein
VNINPPSYYWELSKEIILEIEAELDKEKKYYIDKQLAIKYVKFASLIKLTSGDLAGFNFQFMKWQLEAIINIFAVKYRDGDLKDTRRYQRVLFSMAKKGGKTEFTALLTILLFFLDDEKGKEIYSIASELEQAKILHKSFITMIRQESELEDMIKATIQPPRVSRLNGAFVDEYMALSNTSDSKDGLKPSTVLCDETHTYRDSSLYQIMVDGMAMRKSPLEIHMTTAGYDKTSFYYTKIYQHAKKVKQGIIKDERFYVVLFEPDEEDFEHEDWWKKEEVWRKSNPNYPVSPTKSYMQGKVVQAEQSEEALVAFKVKHLNTFVDKADIWIKHSVWTSNQTPINEDDLIGRTCYGGLDLSSSIDITAIGYIFPKDDGGYDFIVRLFIPKDNMRERVRRDKVPYFDWVKNGIMQVTDGNVIDYAFIQKQIEQDAEKFNIKMMAYDRWNSSDLITRLTNDGTVELVQFGQGFASMSAPTKQIEVLALQGRLNHGNNEALNWMCSNVVLKRDPSDNIKMDKSTSVEKIDGMISLAMSLGICMIDTKEEEKELIYNERGLIDL